MVCLRYIIVSSLHKSDNKNNNNNYGQGFKPCIMESKNNTNSLLTCRKGPIVAVYTFINKSAFTFAAALNFYRYTYTPGHRHSAENLKNQVTGFHCTFF
jgi:hypothetical protein